MTESSGKRTCLRPRPPAPSLEIRRTVDGLPVFNIAVENLPKRIKRNVVAKHFAKFGLIKTINIAYGRTRSKPAQCIVCFRATSGAARALKRRVQTLAGERITVRACPSWEQPFQIDDEHTSSPNTISSIIQLNDYCLELIFQYLKLRDQVRLSLCHPRLEQVFVHMICPRLTRNLSIAVLYTFSLWEMRQYLRTAGQFVRSIEISPPAPTSGAYLFYYHPSSLPQCIYDLIREHCAPRVQKLRVLRCHLLFARYLGVLQVRNITELELFDCEVEDADVLQLRALTALRVLGLGCNGISGQHLSRLRSVERLSLFGCRCVTYVALVAIMQALRLRYLDVRLCYEMFSDSGPVFENCNDLEMLRISCINESDANHIAKLPKLKTLESPLTSINFYRALHAHHADFLQELKATGVPHICPAAQFKNLRVLWLCDLISNESLKGIATLSELEEFNIHYSTRVRGDHLLPVVQKCAKLKRLGLRYCRHINNDFVMATILLLEQRSTPLLMLVGGTRVKKEMLKYPPYLSARRMLELSFTMLTPFKGFINEETEFDVPHGRYDEYNLQPYHNWSESSSEDDDDGDEDGNGSSGWSSDSTDNFNIWLYL